MYWDFLGHLGTLEVLPLASPLEQVENARLLNQAQGSQVWSLRMVACPTCPGVSNLPDVTLPQFFFLHWDAAAKSSPGHSSSQIYSTPPKEKTKTKKPTPS